MLVEKTIAEKLELLNERIPEALDSAYAGGYEWGYTEGEWVSWELGWNDGYAEGESFGYDVGYSDGHQTGYGEGYDAGLNIGVEEGLAQGYENGHLEGFDEGWHAHYDEFWDAFQDYGKRNYYERAFTGYNFNASNFYPKYDIIVKDTGTQVFYAWSNTEEQRFDLAERLEFCGVVLDTSQAKYLDRMFAYGRFLTIPTIDMTSIDGDKASYIFSYPYDNLETIEKIVIHEKVIPNNWFYNCTGLKNLTIEGKLAQSGFDVSSCGQLTEDSILSILKSLSRNITETKTITFHTNHQSIIERQGSECEGYWMDAIEAGWSFVYAGS